MMPTVSRHELESDDIVAEVGIVRMRRNRDLGGNGSARVQCEGKRRHDSFADAHESGKRHGLNAYRCGHCRGWHNGNRNGK